MILEMPFDVMIKEGAKSFSAELDSKQIEMFVKYKDLLLEWNKKVNLTAIEDEKEIAIKHFIDSLSIAPYIKTKREKIIDVGTGAGFPGIPVKILYNNIEVVLVDSLEKRVTFLNNVITELKLRDITSVHSRAEDAGSNTKYREKFDISVARAVASLPVLLEYCMPLTKVGGVFIAMKGSSTDEVADSKKALEQLGGKIEEIKEFVLPFSDIKRNLIIVRKTKQTPSKYPRKAGKPSKEPLI